MSLCRRLHLSRVATLRSPNPTRLRSSEVTLPARCSRPSCSGFTPALCEFLGIIGQDPGDPKSSRQSADCSQFALITLRQFQRMLSRVISEFAKCLHSTTCTLKWSMLLSCLFALPDRLYPSTNSPALCFNWSFFFRSCWGRGFFGDRASSTSSLSLSFALQAVLSTTVAKSSSSRASPFLTRSQ